MQHSQRIFSTNLLFGLIFSANLYAAEDAVMVTATRLNAITANSAGTTLIDAEQISHSSAKTLTDLLDLEAGVDVWSYYGNGANNATVDMRGFGMTAGQNTLILLDGRRLNDIDLSAVDLSAIPLHNIARIEISRSGGSVLYGDGAVGGVINIITKEPARSGSQGFVKLSAGSLRTTTSEAGFSDAQGPASINIAFNNINSDGYRNNNALDQSNIQLDLRLAHDSGEWYVKLAGDNQKLGLPGGRTASQLDNDPRGATTAADLAEQQGDMVTVGYTHLLSANTELVIDVGQRNKEVHSEYSGSDYDQHLDNTSVTPRLSKQHQLWGLAQQTIIGIDYYDALYNDSYTSGDITQTSQALYIQNTAQLSTDTTLTLGLRQQQIDMERPTLGKRSDNEGLYTLGISHQMSPQLSIAANIEHSVRFASVNESSAGYLEPQTADHIDINAQWSVGQGTISATYYTMDVENEIHYDPNVGMFGSNVNLDPTEHNGFEIELAQQLTETVDLRASYTRSEAEFTAGSYQGNTIPMVANDTASLSTRWNVNTRSNILLSARYVGDKFFDNDQANALTDKIPSYTSVDLKLTTQRHDWTLSGTINNLLDKSYYDYGIAGVGWMSVYPHPERTYTLSAQRQF